MLSVSTPQHSCEQKTTKYICLLRDQISGSSPIPIPCTDSFRRAALQATRFVAHRMYLGDIGTQKTNDQVMLGLLTSTVGLLALILSNPTSPAKLAAFDTSALQLPACHKSALQLPAQWVVLQPSSVRELVLGATIKTWSLHLKQKHKASQQ